jgi:alcohol dehydrogenase (cytochrome c)
MFNLRPKSGRAWIAALIVVTGTGLALTAVPKVRLGLTIVRLKASGSLPDIGWMDLFRMTRPGTHFNLPSLAKTPNPYAAIRNPYSLPGDVSAGGNLFRSHCTSCHGTNGSGGSEGPSLSHRHMAEGSSDWALFRTVSSGIRGTTMRGSNLPWVDRWRLVAYVRSLTLRAELPLDSDLAVRALPVSYEQIRDASQKPSNWLTYSGSYDGQRFSPIRQITPANVRDLRLIWARQYNTSEVMIETSPLVVGDRMFVTVPPNRVEALDATNGNLIWAYDRGLPENLTLCCGYVNRGLAVLGSSLFLGTLDGHMVALDINTGQVSWDVEIADYKSGYSITGAPLALKNLVVTGVAGGEFGIRGFVDARDAATGKEVWRFDTIPAPGQPGANTWAGNSWRTGGGPTWITGSFDPETNLLYWPTGNPSPNFDGKERPGDNLYTNCVVALDADDGKLRWYFQFMPHDAFDWDATEIVVLLDGDVAGKRRRLLAQANRNGFFYLLDAKTGQFLLAKAFAVQTWADGIDGNGRPLVNRSAYPTTRGTSVYPGVGGATNWWSPSYSPVTGFLYVSALDWGGVFHEGHSEYHPGELFPGGSFEFFENTRPEGAVRALNPETGEALWEYRNIVSDVGGLLSTAGGIVLGSQGEVFFALDAKTGSERWRVSTGGRIRAAPITFLNGDRQMVTIAAGHDILTFGLNLDAPVPPASDLQASHKRSYNSSLP